MGIHEHRRGAHAARVGVALCMLLFAGCSETFLRSPHILLFDDGRVGMLAMNIYSSEGGEYPGPLSRSVRVGGR